jgi:AraC-like DNA-binding protein
MTNQILRFVQTAFSGPIRDHLDELAALHTRSLSIDDEAAVTYRSAGDDNVALSGVTGDIPRTGRLSPRPHHIVLWFPEGSISFTAQGRGTVVADTRRPTILSAALRYDYEINAERLTMLRVSDRYLRSVAAEQHRPLPPLAVFGQQHDEVAALAPLRTLLRDAGAAITDASLPAQVRAVINRRVAETMLDTFPVEPASAGASDRVAAAVEFIRAHAQENITLPQIADAAGLSERGVQQAFSRDLATTPVSLLRAFRLDQIHAILVAGDERLVGDVARQWQFNHLGRFSDTYRKRFGELPSETVIRVRDEKLNRPV